MFGHHSDFCLNFAPKFCDLCKYWYFCVSVSSVLCMANFVTHLTFIKVDTQKHLCDHISIEKCNMHNMFVKNHQYSTKQTDYYCWIAWFLFVWSNDRSSRLTYMYYNLINLIVFIHENIKTVIYRWTMISLFFALCLKRDIDRAREREVGCERERTDT